MPDDVKIKLTTEADVSGAKQAEDALKKVETQAKKTEGASQNATIGGGGSSASEQIEEIKQVTSAKKEQADWEINAAADVAKAKEKHAARVVESAKKGQLAETAASAAAKLGYEDAAQAITKYGKVVTAEAAAIGASVAAIVVAADWASDALTKTFDGYTDAIAKAKANGIEIDPGFEADINAQRGMIATLVTPITAVKDAWEGLKSAWSNPEDFFAGLAGFNTGMDEIIARMKFAEEAQAKFLKTRLDTSQKNLQLQISRENEELDYQLSVVRQINSARNQSDNIAVQRAQNQVKVAQQDGGDVAAAEANVLLVSLQADLEALRRGLGETRQKAAAAEEQMDSAKALLDDAIAKGASEARIMELDQQATDKVNAYVLLDKEVKNQSALIGQKATLLAENTEIALVDLQDKNKGAISKAAQKGIDAVQAEIEKVANSPETIAQSAAVVKTITDGANATTEKINQAVTAVEPINAAQQQSVSGLQTTLETQGQIAEKLATAVQALNTEQGKILGVIQQVQSGVSSRDSLLQKIISDVQNMQLQISQLLMK